MAFHKVHCPRCGRTMYADELAFDFGEILNVALEKAKNRTFGKNEEWYDLTQLNLCLYLTLEDLKKEYGFSQVPDGTYEGNFTFTTSHLAKQLVRLADSTNPNMSIDILASGTDMVEYEKLTKAMAKSSDVDRGRVLSGLNGVDLANDPENLRFTNKSLNASMGADEIPDYVAKHPELDEKTKGSMLREYESAKKSYENKLARAYYTSPRFVKDVGLAAGKVGAQMGVRQALGFVFTEVTFTVFDEFKNLAEPFDLKKLFQSLGEGIKKGFKNVKKKYKELLARIEQGLTAGILSSLTTTLCNIFFTTAKNVVRIIRQTYASLVEAAKVLFLNPENLPFGERLRATAKILSTGISIVLGTMVSELIEQTPIGKIPVLGEAVQTFCGALVSGLLTCSLVYYFDRSEAMNRLVSVLNNVHTISTEVNYFKQQAALFEQYAAELEGLDSKKFQKETQIFIDVVNNLDAAKDEKQLNELLKEYIILTGGSLPWKGDFDSFMKQKEIPLVFA